MSNYETLSEMNERALSDVAKDEIISKQQSVIIKLIREHSIEIGKLKRELEIAKRNAKDIDSYIRIDGTKLKTPVITIGKNEITPLAFERAKQGTLMSSAFISDSKIIRPKQKEIDELEIMLSASQRENIELKRIIENQKKAILKLAKD